MRRARDNENGSKRAAKLPTKRAHTSRVRRGKEMLTEQRGTKWDDATPASSFHIKPHVAGMAGSHQGPTESLGASPDLFRSPCKFSNKKLPDPTQLPIK